MRPILFSISFCLFAVQVPAAFYHLELGGANYGQEGNTQRGNHLTYSGNGFVIPKVSFINSLESHSKEAPSEAQTQFQYQVLFDTLDALVERHPNETVVFDVNDLNPEWAKFAAEQMRKHALYMQYKAVVIRDVGGDYTELSAADTLAPYGENLYDSVHLKNTEAFYAYTIAGESPASSKTSREKARRKLQKLANLSKSGLYFFPIMHDFFFPDAERTDSTAMWHFYGNTSDWKTFPYYFPRMEWSFPSSFTRVFFVPRETREWNLETILQRKNLKI